MASVSIDTFSIARDLKAAEFAPVRTEAIALALGRAIADSAATKSDLREVKLELEAKIEQLRATLTTWFVGTILTLGAVIIAAVKL